MGPVPIAIASAILPAIDSGTWVVLDRVAWLLPHHVGHSQSVGRRKALNNKQLKTLERVTKGNSIAEAGRHGGYSSRQAARWAPSDRFQILPKTCSGLAPIFNSTSGAEA